MKVCSKCKQEKPFEKFGKRASSKDGLRFQCKDCRKQHYEQNKEREQERTKRWREQNKERIQERTKQWREQNKESISEYQKQYYEQNKERFKQYREQNKERNSEYQKQYRRTPSGRFCDYKSGAKQRGIEFHLTMEQFESFWQKPCEYCGAEIETIGLDRVDSDGHYTIDNVVACCFPCNDSKGKKTLEEWKKYLDNRKINC
tara:strand:+ start:64 stop:669 length:606 start_codon:yes stop_codon:yes gene_type:complete